MANIDKKPVFFPDLAGDFILNYLLPEDVPDAGTIDDVTLTAQGYRQVLNLKRMLATPGTMGNDPADIQAIIKSIESGATGQKL